MKKALRAEIAARVDLLDSDYKSAADAAIQKNVKNLPAYNASKFLFCYVSIDSEPNTYSILASALMQGKRVCVPKCLKKGIMEAHEIKSIEDLRPGFFNIPEPKETCPAIRKDQIDFCVIPCVSCSHDGKRLGHGMGYYDRYLEGVEAPFAALCYEKLISEEIPTDEYDKNMDFVITETGIYENPST